MTDIHCMWREGEMEGGREGRKKAGREGKAG